MTYSELITASVEDKKNIAHSYLATWRKPDDIEELALVLDLEAPNKAML